ncbi:hypothetical protein EVAR_82379_1 [Eumeta japonica]|uniref:Uncharacterized protein n=1 Tax=Eumeta variegata TaxID=151549 RepID=A0A4C1UBB1_EUMVA|nr:hypothetical protein EVAR_82379_1 [Eumeta japonica]
MLPHTWASSRRGDFPSQPEIKSCQWVYRHHPSLGVVVKWWVASPSGPEKLDDREPRRSGKTKTITYLRMNATYACYTDSRSYRNDRHDSWPLIEIHLRGHAEIISSGLCRGRRGRRAAAVTILIRCRCIIRDTSGRYNARRRTGPPSAPTPPPPPPSRHTEHIQNNLPNYIWCKPRFGRWPA